MYCPSCGTEYTIELKYCNRCGANLSTTLDPPPAQLVPISLTKPAIVIGALITLLTLGGFGLLIGGAVELSRAGIGTDPTMAVIVLGMLIILTADIFLVRLLTKIISAALPTLGQTKSHRVHAPVPPVQLAQPTTARLQPAPSVTENTTRFFEHAYRAPAETEDRAAIDKIEP